MTRMETDRLIADLANATTGTPRRSNSPRATLSATSLVSFVAALAIAVTLFGSLADVASSFTNPWLYWKLLCMSVVAAGAWTLTRDLAQPGYKHPQVAILLAAVAILAAGAMLDPSTLHLGGRVARSVPICLAAIVTQSLPGIVLILLRLRTSATTTRPRLTGAAAGLLAGSLGAAAYAFVCRNDGGLFVFVWYSTAVGIAAIIGAALGRRFLSW